MKKVLITGVAGFIGFHLAKKWQQVYEVHGLDFFDTESDVLQRNRLENLGHLIHYHPADIRDFSKLERCVREINPDIIVHLAACTGIANSSRNSRLYFDTNVRGFNNILELCKELKTVKLLYASSSSVYNERETAIFKEEDATDNQLSFYGTTKKMDELMAASYAALNGLTCVGMRFFTVYGSWVRPDMAALKFMDALFSNKPVVLYNNGDVFRDFTHVSDIVEGISSLAEKYLLSAEANGVHDIFNIGNGSPVKVKDYLFAIAENLKVTPEIIFKPLPANELSFTHADTAKLYARTGFRPSLSLEEGIKEMTDWFILHHKMQKTKA